MDKTIEGKFSQEEEQRINIASKKVNKFIYDEIVKIFKDQKMGLIAHYAILKGLKDAMELSLEGMGITVEVKVGSESNWKIKEEK